MATPIPDNRARFTVDEVAAATGGRVLPGPAGPVPSVSVTSDSRAVRPGSLFVALRGESHDGHVFAAAAARAGAAIVVVERGRTLGDLGAAAVVEVDDTLDAWGALARAHLARWRSGATDRRVVAITGSAGKTTTKELTAALLAEVAPTHSSAGNLNNRIGVPAVVFALELERRDERFCVLEMGMSLPGELDAITGFAPPDVGVVVNVGVAHSEGVGGREGVMREKGAVYRALGPSGTAIVNADDAFVVRAAAEARPARILTFGRARDATYRLVSRVPTSTGSRVVLAAPSRACELAIELPLLGEAAAVDCAAALAAAEAASGVVLSDEAIGRALGRVRLEGRGAVLRLGDVVVVDDTYNANPASMRAGLATLAELAGTGRRRVAILGEMKELGDLAEDEHRALGDAVHEAGVSLLIGCGGLIARTLERAEALGVAVVHAPDPETAAREATVRVADGDVVLVKGSRGVQAEKVIRALRERFDA